MAKKQIAKPHEPKPLRQSSELARLLLQLEVEDCDCPLAKLCTKRRDHNSELCEESHSCECLPTLLGGVPCRHVQRADHNLSPEEWESLLRAYDLNGYADPPEPPAEIAIPKEDRLALYEWRVSLGYAARSPMDQHSGIDEVSVQGVAGKRESVHGADADRVSNRPAPKKPAIDEHEPILLDNWERIRERHQQS